MRRLTILLSLAVLICTFYVPVHGFEVVGFKGSTWGELKYDMPTDPEYANNNLGLTGWTKQGIDWFKLGDNATFNTYVKLHYKWDQEEIDWNNLIGPCVGISIDAYSPKGIVGTVGIEYVWERHFSTDPVYTTEKFMVYLNWYGWWDLKK